MVILLYSRNSGCLKVPEETWLPGFVFGRSANVWA
jgi:hypothetical protein